MTEEYKTINIFGKNKEERTNKIRVGCRGIIIDGDKILVSHEINTDFFLIPGGGLEKGESEEECCVREVCEETGFITEPLKKFLILNEYYGSTVFISHYYECAILKKGEAHLTETEKERGLVPEFIDINELYIKYSEYGKLENVNEEKRGSYQREYTALTEYLDNNVKVLFARREDIPSWMELVLSLCDSFPGLCAEDYKNTLIKNIERRTALCVKKRGRIAGILLFSPNMRCLSCLAVAPEFRREGIASALIEKMIFLMPDGDISVTTFREGDEKGNAARALYKKAGFTPCELLTEFDYPVQKFILRR